MTVQFLHCRNFMVVRLEGERTVAMPFERMHLVENLLVRVFVRRHVVIRVHARTLPGKIYCCNVLRS
jgi:hypothetical protein